MMNMIQWIGRKSYPKTMKIKTKKKIDGEIKQNLNPRLHTNYNTMSSAPKKYIPPSMRGSTEATSSAASQPSSRWTYTSRDASGSEQSLRNTSQASRVAPELAPAIIAPAARNPLGFNSKKPALSSQDEFPTMGAAAPKPAVNAWSNSKPTFAEMSRAWAEKKKQEDEEKKAAAEKQASIDRELRAQQEKEQKERRHLMMSIHSLQQQKIVTRVDKYDIGGNEDEYHDSDSISSEEYVDEEVDEEVVDDTWERSRGKHDYY